MRNDSALAYGDVYEAAVHEPEEQVDLERYWIGLSERSIAICPDKEGPCLPIISRQGPLWSAPDDRRLFVSGRVNGETPRTTAVPVRKASWSAADIRRITGNGSRMQ